MKKHKFRVLTLSFLAVLAILTVVFAPDFSDAKEACEADICLIVPDNISISLGANTNETSIHPLILQNSSTTSAVNIDKISAGTIDLTYSFELYSNDFSSFEADSKKIAIAIEAYDSTIKDVTGTEGYALNEIIPAGNTSKFNLKGKSSVFTNNITETGIANFVITFSATDSAPRTSDCFSTELEKWNHIKDDASKTITIGKFLGDNAFSTPERKIPNDKNIIICNSYMINGESYTAKLSNEFNVEENGETAKSVIFGQNVDSIELTNADDMFRDMIDLEKIMFPDNFGSNITTASLMFYYAGKNATITANLTSLDTSNITDMSYMFAFSGFETLDLSNFNTSKVEDMRYMFVRAEKIENLDLTSFDTSNVTDLSCTFNHMLSLKTLDLSSFNTSKVDRLFGTFYNSSKLETIYVGDGWSTESVNSYKEIFGGTESLIGGMGTKWSNQHEWRDFARADEAEYDKNGNYIQGNQGYFTYKCSPKALLLDDGTLYFTCDNTTHLIGESFNHGNSIKTIQASYEVPSSYKRETTLPWKSKNKETFYVDIDQKYRNFKPTITMELFSRMQYILSFNNMQYMNMSKVTDASGMFRGTAVYNEEEISLDLSQWNTENMQNIEGMFEALGSCVPGKVSLNVSGWNTSKVTSLYYTFRIVGARTHVGIEIKGLSTWNTQNVEDMEGTFSEIGLESSEDAIINIGDISKWNTSNVKYMRYAFAYNGMKKLDISGWDTSKVEDMAEMFVGTIFNTIDLTSFNTEKVTEMTEMFYDAEVERIYVSEDWFLNENLVSDNMFLSTDNLIGGAGSDYGTYGDQDANFAHIDGGEDNPGYFTGPDQIPRYAKVVVDTEGNVSFNYDYTDYYAPGDQYTSVVFGTKTVDNSYYLGDDSYNDDMDEAWGVRLSYGDKEIINVNIEDGFKDLDLSTIYSDTIDFVYEFNDIIRTVNEKRTVNLTNLKNINMTGLTDITRMFSSAKIDEISFAGFDTSEVESMQELFDNTTFAGDLDISEFDTSNVTNMIEMFAGTKLTTGNIIFPDDFGKSADNMSYMFSGSTIIGDLNLSSFSTENVTNMNGMFKALNFSGNIVFPENFGPAVEYMAYMFLNNTSINDILDLSNFNTSQVISLYRMFMGASKITQIIFPENFAPNATDTEEMFKNADSLTSIDLTNFKFTELESTVGMFSEMDSLEEIVVPTSRIDWKYRIQDGYSDNMFTNTPNLPGYSSENANDETYAHAGIIDGIQGYFTSTPYNDDSKCVGECEAKTLLLDSNELVFVYDSNDYTEDESVYQTNRGESTVIEIGTPGNNTIGMYDNVITVHITKSFADYIPDSTEGWFCGLKNLKSISNLEQINTSSVTSMARMFKNASSLTELDLSGFEMSNVENVYEMFSGMTNLEHIYVSTGTDWETNSNILNGGYLFNGDTKLPNYNKSYTTSYSDPEAYRAFIGLKRGESDRFGLFTDVCEKNKTCTISTGGLTFAQAFEQSGKEVTMITIGRSYHYYYKMQDMTPEICSAVKTATSTSTSDTESELLIDTRSNRPYTVAKLLDGNCWMTRDLSLEGNRNLDSTETDIADSSTSIYLKNWSSFSTNPTVVTGTSYDESNYYVMTNKKTSSSYVNNYNSGNGWYYNSEAAYATASQVTVSESQTGKDYTDSICPKGWDLPSGSMSKTSPAPNMYSMLTTYYSGVDGNQAPLNFTNTGAINGLNANNLNKSGAYYITSTVNHKGYDEILASGGINTVHTNGTSFSEGAIPGNTILVSIRCVAASTEWNSQGVSSKQSATNSTIDVTISDKTTSASSSILGLQPIENFDSSISGSKNETEAEEETTNPLGVEEKSNKKLWVTSIILLFLLIILPLVIILMKKKQKDDEQYIEII